jgi:hypothetical protein
VSVLVGVVVCLKRVDGGDPMGWLGDRGLRVQVGVWGEARERTDRRILWTLFLWEVDYLNKLSLFLIRVKYVRLWE